MFIQPLHLLLPLDLSIAHLSFTVSLKAWILHKAFLPQAPGTSSFAELLLHFLNSLAPGHTACAFLEVKEENVLKQKHCPHCKGIKDILEWDILSLVYILHN